MLADNTTVVTALGKHVRKLPQELRRDMKAAAGR